MSKRIGICFGDYCPMNQSHLNIIMHAKKESDIVYVIVCNYNENTSKKLNIDINTRKRLIKEYFKDDEFIRIMSVNDIDGNIKNAMSITDWKQWTDKVKKTVVNNVMNHNSNWPFSPDDDIEAFELKLTFYISEKYYDEILSELDYNTKLIKNNNINNVIILQNPLLYWDKIIPTFKPMLTKKILVLGTEHTGKSTLVKDIANYFQTSYITEYNKDYMNEHNISKSDINVNDFIECSINQRKKYFEALNSNKNKGVIISDTDNITNLMYVKAYMKNMQITEDQYKNILVPFVKSLQTNIDWDVIYLIKPNNDNKENYNILVNLLENFNLLHKVVEIEGTYIDYFDYIKNYINSLYENY